MQHINIFTKTRWLVTIMLLTTLCAGQMWGATGAINASSEIILPAGSTTGNYTKTYWQNAGAPAYSTSNDVTNTITISSTAIGSVRFYHAGYNSTATEYLMLQSANGYIETVISSVAGVDVEIYMKSNGNGSITAALTGATSQTVSGTSFGKKNLSTTNTSATLKVTTASKAGQIAYIKITPKSSSCTAPTAVALENGSITATGATLTVTDSENTNKYDFCCATSSTASKTVTASVNSSKSKAISGLNYGTTYYYWARTDCGSSTYSSWYPASNPSSFTTLCPAPTSVSAGSLTTSGVTFTITDNNDPKVNNYEIYYSTTNAEPGASPSGTATTTSETKAVTGLAAGTEYFFWVRSKGPNANSSWVSGGSFTTVTLSSITISTPPTTVDYLDGETFSKTGAVVTANYSNSTSATVSASWNKTTLSTSDESVTASYTENGVTKTKDQAIHVYSVTVLKQDEQGTAISADGVSAGVDVRTLSASATTASKYVFKGWKYATGGEGGTAISGNSLTGIPTGNVTVIAEFYKPITVTWIVNQGDWNDKGGTTKVAYNTSWSALDLPTAPVPNENGCGHKFMGWTTTANYSNATTAPSDLLNSANQSSKTGVKVTNNVIFYAVFADYDDND